MRKKPVRKLLVACIAGALFLPGKCFPLGLGDIEVNSALNQKLDADIKLLSAKPEDTSKLIVKLASQKEFSRAGINRSFMLNNLHFKPVVINNVAYIKVSSNNPIREPFLSFLLEVDWPEGHLLREYTVLLDPPSFMIQNNAAPAQTSHTGTSNAGFRPSANKVTSVSPSVSSAPAVAASTGFRPATNRATLAPAMKSPASPTSRVISQYQPASDYRVRPGDTAWRLADKMRPDRSVSVEQMMLALLRANPDAFIKKNINGLKRGYILRIPDKADIAAMSPAQARVQVKQQTALWRKYRHQERTASPVSALNSKPGLSATDKTQAASSGTKGTVTKDSGGHLKIVSAGTGASTSSVKDPTAMNAVELRAALAVSREKLETTRVEKEALQQQIDQLKHQAGKTKGILSVENGELSAAQARDDAVVKKENTAITTKENTPGSVAAKTAAPAAATPPATEQPKQTAPPVKPAPAPVSATDHKAKNLLTRLLNNPKILAVGGGGLLLILALIYLIIKRRKSAVEVDDNTASDESSTDLEDIATMAEADNDDTEAEADVAESTLVMDATDGSDDTMQTETKAAVEAPRDDVIAEADVYLAYGIYQQAEDLLKNAIKESPDRDDYRAKLAETYYASKNKEAFIDVATELKQRSQGEDTLIWKKIIAMGQDMCADHALFQGDLVGGLDQDALGTQSPQPMDFDLGMDAVEESVEEIDISLDEPIELPEMEEVSVSEQDDSVSEQAEKPAVEDALKFDSEDETRSAVEDETDSQFDENEFSLDIDVAELDIDDQADRDLKAESVDAKPDTNIDDTTQDMEATMQIDSGDLGFDLDDNQEENGDAIVTDDAVAVAEPDETASDKTIIDLTDEALSGETSSEQDQLDTTDTSELDFDPGLDDEAVTSAKEELTEAEMTDVDETNRIAPEVEPSADDATQPSADEDEFDLSSLDDVDEIGTKLDLARAYLDMGDHEGARDILEEVLADGNETQQQEAKELVSQLDT